jgi:hypothetical protein
MSVRNASSSRIAVDGLIAAVAVLFIAAFPKAGILVGEIPLNVSLFVGLGLAAWGWLHALARLDRPEDRLSGLVLGVVFAGWTLNFVHAISFYSLGARDVAFMLFVMVSFFGLGIALLYRARPGLAFRSGEGLRRAFVFLLVYALLQVLLGAELVAVRNVTAIYGDEFSEVISRHNVLNSISRDTYKIFATYQNGNMFATALILMAPVAMSWMRTDWGRLSSLFFFNIVIIYTGTLSAYIGGLVLNVLFFAFFMRRYFMLLPVMLLGAVAVVWLYVFVLCQGAACRMQQLIQARALERSVLDDPRLLKIGQWLESLDERPLTLLTGQIHGADSFIRETFVFSLAQHFGVPLAILILVFMLLLLRPLKFRFYKAGLYAYAVSSFGESAFWSTPTPFLIGMILGIAVVMDGRGEAPADRHAAAGPTPSIRPAAVRLRPRRAP